MWNRLPAAIVAATLAVSVAAPARAANKEHQQLAADIRMLQEQTQQLQVLLGTIGDAIKAVNTRLDEQNSATRKAFADQKLTIDNLSNDLRVVREKVDDNNVRIASLTQELDALRQTIAQQPPAPRPTTEPEAAPGAGTAPAAPAVAPGTSPARLYEMAWSDYTSGQYDLAIQGFESYIRAFPKSDQAADAQVKIGTAYMMGNQYDKAVASYDVAIRSYPNAKALPEAHYQKGIALRHLGQLDRAREAFELVSKTYPDSDAGRLAKQALDQMTLKR